MTVFAAIRLILAGLCLLLGLTAIIPASSVPIWMLSVGATEYGHWFGVLAALLALLGGIRPSSPSVTILALVAAGLFFSTSLRALSFGRNLPTALKSAFGGTPPEEPAFSWKTLFFGSAVPTRDPESLIYRRGEGYELRMNFYRSASSQASPCVIVVHTGGWNSGSPDEFLAFNSHLAERGYAVAALEYRLAPEWIWPAQLEDVEAGLEFLKARSGELGIDAERFVLLGRSAGGHIAETAAYSLEDPAIKGCVAFYAPADLNYAYRYGREDDLLKSPQMLRDFLGGSPSEEPENYDTASAIRFVNPASPPTLLMHGRSDPLVWNLQSRRLSEKLKSEGVAHLLVELPWGTHAFDHNFDGPGGQLSRFAVDYFLLAVTQ